MFTTSTATTQVPYSPIRPDFRQLDVLAHAAATGAAVSALAPHGSDHVARSRSAQADARRFSEAIEVVIANGDLADYAAYATFAKAKRETS